MPTRKLQAPVIIAPSVLSADFSRLGAQIKETVKAGCTWIHLDIMDNHFVPNLTFGPPVVKALRKVSAKAYFDAHLMTEDPASLVEPFAKAGVQSLTVHVEACGNETGQVLSLIQSHGMKAGLSIKPDTPFDAVAPFLSQLDLFLVMTVEPGFGGQALIPQCLNKIREARKLREKNSYKYQIQADGGINEDTAGLVAASGCEILVAGSAIYNKNPIADNVSKLLKSVK